MEMRYFNIKILTKHTWNGMINKQEKAAIHRDGSSKQPSNMSIWAEVMPTHFIFNSNYLHLIRVLVCVCVYARFFHFLSPNFFHILFWPKWKWTRGVTRWFRNFPFYSSHFDRYKICWNGEMEIKRICALGNQMDMKSICQRMWSRPLWFDDAAEPIYTIKC